MPEKQEVVTFDLFPDLLSGWEEEWQDMPEFLMEDKTAFKVILVNFENMKDVKAFAELMKQSITPSTKYIWFPEKKPFPCNTYRYVDEKTLD